MFGVEDTVEIHFVLLLLCFNFIFCNTSSGNACYHSVQNLLSSTLLSKNININICGNIILPVVLYECETWSLKLREGRRLGVFENRVLMRIFGIKRNEVTGEWRILHNKQLDDMNALPNTIRVIKSRRMRWAGHVAYMGRGTLHTCMVFVGKPEGNKQLERPRGMLKDNIKMGIRELG